MPMPNPFAGVMMDLDRSGLQAAQLEIKHRVGKVWSVPMSPVAREHYRQRSAIDRLQRTRQAAIPRRTERQFSWALTRGARAVRTIRIWRSTLIRPVQLGLHGRGHRELDRVSIDQQDVDADVPLMTFQ